MCLTPSFTFSITDREFVINTGEEGCEFIIEDVKDVCSIDLYIQVTRYRSNELYIKIKIKQNITLYLYDNCSISTTKIFETFNTIYNLISPYMDIKSNIK